MAALSITPANVGVSASSRTPTSVRVTEAVTQGEIGYKVGSTGYGIATMNDTEAKAAARGMFISAAASDGQALFIESGFIKIGATTVAGVYYVLGVDGAINPIDDLTVGQRIVGLFLGTGTDEVNLKIDNIETTHP